ncbi:hypothetical protein [Methylobacterium sp. A52T]
MPHFVMKRGHRGRYRFTFMSGDATLSGEVQTDPALMDRAQADLLVRRKILEIAGVFALWMEKDVAGEHDDARSFLRRAAETL